MRRITEETVLFISIFKWFVLSSIVGVMVGLSTTVFLFLLNQATTFSGRYEHYFLFLPVALFLSAWITRLAPEASGHGTEKVIEAVHKHSSRIKAAVVPVKLLTTIITLASGGAAGKEGPCAQIGGGLASVFATSLKFSPADRKKLVICGISAGFASVFGTPIAGAIFGIEVLFVGGIMYEILLPSFIAGVTAYQISSYLGASYFYHEIPFIPAFSELFFFKVVFSGIFFGICSLFLIEIMTYLKQVEEKIPFQAPVKGFLGGVVLVLLTLAVSTRYLGLGLETIEGLLKGQVANWWDFLIKMLFTGITLSFGGSGGIVTPVFFIGAAAGSFYGHILGLDPATFAAIGMVSLLAGAANTPIAASILAVELFGPKVAPYAAVACVTSFLMTGHRSVYPSQVLAIMKSSSFKEGIGRDVEDMQAEFVLRKRSLTRLLLSLTKKFFEKIGKGGKE
ncbi:MAG: chloride channel protein [Proteobacteria bacterium]|nr:chloride channel protein [Pseudomonadota bacterium]MBU1739128.1 chloride channel protein [Pseudomonadota bacterium]